MDKITITDVRCIITAPENINLVVVRVDTSEAGLYGYGCATFAYRTLAVKTIVDEYLKPLLVGRSVHDITEIWQLMYQNAYWRNDVVSANAISGVDMALWDIKGKLAEMPLYSLFGGQVRKGAAVYRHASGSQLEEILSGVKKYQAEGVRHIRVQWGHYGGILRDAHRPADSLDGEYYDPKEYMRRALEMVEYIRSNTDEHLELLHDVHERLTPIDAVGFAADMEQFKLFFLEDLLPPEQVNWFREIRQRSSTPLAMGELFTHPLEWDQLIRERLIDFIRVHISMIGGITPARQLAAVAEHSGVLTAWHGPGDLSPVGHAVNVHLDVSSRNFGIQEWAGISERLHEVFPGSPELRNGFVYAPEKPGIGVDVNEKLAAKYPPIEGVTRWTQTRLPDGSLNVP